MSHTWIRHVISHVPRAYVPCYESCHTWEWVVLWVSIRGKRWRNNIHVNTTCCQSCPTCVCVMLRIMLRMRISRLVSLYAREKVKTCHTRECFKLLVMSRACMRHATNHVMGWLRFVGSFNLWVSVAGYSLFYRAPLQKRPIILRNLLVEATPYTWVWVMSWVSTHEKMQSHITHMNASCAQSLHTIIIAHKWAASCYESRHTCEWVMFHVHMSHVARTNEIIILRTSHRTVILVDESALHTR